LQSPYPIYVVASPGYAVFIVFFIFLQQTRSQLHQHLKRLPPSLSCFFFFKGFYCIPHPPQSLLPLFPRIPGPTFLFVLFFLSCQHPLGRPDIKHRSRFGRTPGYPLASSPETFTPPNKGHGVSPGPRFFRVFFYWSPLSKFPSFRCLARLFFWWVSSISVGVLHPVKNLSSLCTLMGNSPLGVRLLASPGCLKVPFSAGLVWSLRLFVPPCPFVPPFPFSL